MTPIGPDSIGLVEELSGLLSFVEVGPAFSQPTRQVNRTPSAIKRMKNILKSRNRKPAESAPTIFEYGNRVGKIFTTFGPEPAFDIINVLMHHNLRKTQNNIGEPRPVDLSHYERSTFLRWGEPFGITWAIKVLLVSTAALVSVLVAPVQSTGFFSNSLPSRIVTADGIIYTRPKLLNVAPDGLVIEYLLDSGGTGMAKVRFAKLPDILQRQFSYDPKKVLSFETEQSNLMSALVQKEQLDEAKQRAMRAEMSRKPDPILVQAADPAVDYQYYDLSGPKPLVIAEGMTGNTRNNFECHSAPTVRLVQKGEEDGDYLFRCEAITVEIGLSNTITLPKGVRQKLMAHEEGHRRINEHFYAFGQQAALRAGKFVLGKEFVFLYVSNPEDFRRRYAQSVFSQDKRGLLNRDGQLLSSKQILPSSSKDLDIIEANAVRAAQSTLQGQYWQFTKIPANQANKYYDEITNHGRNDVDSEKAVQEALDHFQPQLTN